MVLWSINPFVGRHNLHHAEPFNYSGKTPLKELEEERRESSSIPCLLYIISGLRELAHPLSIIEAPQNQFVNFLYRPLITENLPIAIAAPPPAAP